MEPASIMLPNKKRFRPTIPSSKDRLLKLVDDISQTDAQLKLFYLDRQRKKLKIYPIIFGIAENYDLVSKFLLKYNDICYEFDSFVEALDAAFKFYIFFKLPFSPEHKRLWVLLNGLFYKIESDLLEETSAITSCIKSFKFKKKIKYS